MGKKEGRKERKTRVFIQRRDRQSDRIRSHRIGSDTIASDLSIISRYIYIYIYIIKAWIQNYILYVCIGLDFDFASRRRLKRSNE